MYLNIKRMFEEPEFDKDIDPCRGIGTKAFDAVSRLTPIVNVDLLIINENHNVLVSWRKDDVCGEGWHIPGGVVRYKETFAERLLKVAKEEIGIPITFDEQPLEINEILLPQSVRGHFISFLFRCYPEKEIITSAEKKQYDAGDLHWYKAATDIPLVKGQREYYTKYLKQ